MRLSHRLTALALVFLIATSLAPGRARAYVDEASALAESTNNKEKVGPTTNYLADPVDPFGLLSGPRR